MPETVDNPRMSVDKHVENSNGGYPQVFGLRGSQLWAKLGQSSEYDPSGVLATEACRIADRLDALESMLAGGDLTVLQEARLQSAALKALLESPVLKVSEGKADPLDDLARAREARLATAAGVLGSEVLDI